MIRKGLTVIVILLFIGIAVSPSIYANRGKVIFEPIIENDSFNYDGYNPIQLVFLLLSKLNNHIEIQNINSEDNILEIIDSDAELNDIVVKLKSFDCGCGDEETLKWSYPILCLILCPLAVISAVIFIKFHWSLVYEILMGIGSKLNCYWA